MEVDPVLIPVGLDDAGLFALALGEEDEERYWPLVMELHRRGSVVIFDLALDALNSVEPSARAKGADVLGQLGYPVNYPFRDQSVPPLVERVINDGNTSVIDCAVTALGHLRDDRGLAAVIGAATHSDDLVRLSVAMALPALRGSEPVPPDAPVVAALISLMYDEDFLVRDWATFGLGAQTNADSPQVRGALADRLADSDEVVRGEAILGLARRRDRRAIAAALSLLAQEDADESAVDNAVEAAGLLRAEVLLPALLHRSSRSVADAERMEDAVRRCDPKAREDELQMVTKLMGRVEEVAPWARVEISSELFPSRADGSQIVVRSGRRELNYDFDSLLDRWGTVEAIVDSLVSDGALLPSGVDPEVWVETDGGLRCYLVGNAHTHLGRMLAWVEDVGYLYVSKYEIADSSDRANDWVAGFIAGSEPDLEVYLGRVVPLPGEPTEEDVARWAAALDHYRKTGTLRTLGYVPTLPLPESVEPWWAWAIAGHQVYRWDGHAWRATDEPVASSGELIARTVCTERGHCSMAVAGDAHIVCEDCGSTTEVELD